MRSPRKLGKVLDKMCHWSDHSWSDMSLRLAKATFLPSLPLEWGDERPWEQGWIKKRALLACHIQFFFLIHGPSIHFRNSRNHYSSNVFSHMRKRDISISDLFVIQPPSPTPTKIPLDGNWLGLVGMFGRRIPKKPSSLVT